MFQKGIPKTFIGFLIASFFIWLLNTFSKEYTTTMNYELTFENLPQDLILDEQSGAHPLSLQVRASGFKIIRSSIKNKIIRIDASMIQSKKATEYFVLLKQIKQEIQNQLISGVDLVAFDQDSVFIEMGRLASKKVPLVPNLALNFHKGYELLEPLEIIPDSVLISGREYELSNIEALALEQLRLNDVKASFKKELAIQLPKGISDLKINKTKVTVLGNVDKFTEGKIRVPISIINLPEGVNLTMLNDEVEITYVVALSNFNDIVSSSFRVVCDYNLVVENKLDHLVPKLTKQPTVLKSYKMSPHKIDFLIKK